jgi:cytochrome c-type biogenesis protein CcmH
MIRAARPLMRWAAAAALMLPGALPSPAAAQTPATAQSPTTPQESRTLDAETDRRLRALSAELRCLVCQNQSLADSNAELAVDLRRQVETMIARGDDDAQIKTFLVQRYGDFVLYRPPVQGNTALLWFGPFGLLLVGAVVWALVQRRSRQAARESAPSEAETAHARRLLDD